MAFIGDMRSIMNYPESLDNETRQNVRRITWSDEVLEDEDGADKILDYEQSLGTEDEEMLKWQPRTENWQFYDFDVPDTQTNLSRSLCQGLHPYNDMGLSLFGEVTDSDTHQTRNLEPQSLSTNQHGSLTIHSVSDEQVQLPSSRDRFPEDRCSWRWRSHDNIPLGLSAEKPFCREFWLMQWDVVNMTDSVNDAGLVAIEPVTGLGINHSRPCLDPPNSERQSKNLVKFFGIRFREKRRLPWVAEVRPRRSKNKICVGVYESPEAAARAVDAGRYFYNLKIQVLGKFSGVRYRKDRPSPWIAEVKPRGSKAKISVGCYKSREAAARAVDAGRYFYNLNLDKLNFPDSVRFLDKIQVPPNLNEKSSRAFVLKQAHLLAKLAEKPPSTRISAKLNFPDSVRFLDKIQVPPNLNEQALRAFVCKQAHQLARLAEKPPSTAISETRSCSTNTEGFTSRNISSARNSGDHNMIPWANVSFPGLPTAIAGAFATPSMDSARDLQANLTEVKSSVLQLLGQLNNIERHLHGCMRPSTSFDSGDLREQENHLLSTNRFTTNSPVSAGDFHRPELESTYTHEASLAPVRNPSLGEASNDFFNVLDIDWDGNPEQDIPDDSSRIRASDIPSVGLSHSNHLIQEMQSQSMNLSFSGYVSEPLGAGSEQAWSNGVFAMDMNIFDWTDSFEEGC